MNLRDILKLPDRQEETMDNESLAAAFKALGDPTRLRIYQAMVDRGEALEPRAAHLPGHQGQGRYLRVQDS